MNVINLTESEFIQHVADFRAPHSAWRYFGNQPAIVDFYAGWCGPCRAEIPNLLSVYEKYKGDRFEVLGVATWDKPEDTKTAIEQLNITYPQIMNAQYAGSNAYGINGIPQIVLFGPDGTILKRNLRGAAIEEAVKEVLE